MIHRTILHKTEGSQNFEGTTLTYTYQLIADKLDTAGQLFNIISNASSSIALPDRLPKKGDILDNLCTVDSVNLTWANDANFRGANPQDGKKVWWYEVTASSNVNTENAYDITLTPVYYDEFTEYCYRSSETDSLDREYRLTNAVGDGIGRNVKLWNVLLSFTYYTNIFEADWVNEFLNSVNRSAIQVAGIDIPRKGAKITELTPTVQTITSSSGQSSKRYQVKVGIEIEFGKAVSGDKLIGNGFNAFFKESNDKYVKRKIQRWMASTVFVNGTTLVVTPDKAGIANVQAYFTALNTANKANGIAIVYDPKFVTDENGNWHNYLGYFGGVVGATEGQWEDIQEPVVLNADGTVCTKTTIQLNDSSLDIIDALDTTRKDWKALGFPKTGFLS